MAEYIERTEELMLAVNAGARVIENTKRYHGASYCIGVFSADHKEIPYLKAAEVLRGFDGIPAADVAPVRHGRWVSLRKGDWTSVYECSECKRKETVGCDRSKADEQVKRLYPYCHCGAIMDG